jgi:integrase/recombinase XerD
METVTLKPLLHRHQECIGIFYAKHTGLEKTLRKLPALKWSKTQACWYIPLTETGYKTLVTHLKDVVPVDNSALRQYLQTKKKVAATLPEPVYSKTIESRHAGKPLALSPAWQLSAANLAALESFVQMLQLKAYSKSTIATYRNEFIQLLKLLKEKSVDALTVEDLKRYMSHVLVKERISENTAHSRLNALKFYYEQVLSREKFFWEIPRPKKAQLLPRVFSQDEIAAIIKSVKNCKHKTMLMLAYSAGLRVSEVVSLRTYNIESSRMTIFLSAAKGKKDRVVTLSPVLLVMLREYAREYKPATKGYLFEGAQKGQPYSSRSLQEVLAAAKKKAGIMRPGSIHSLRHSFATHLVERGTDVTMLQKLLGHNDINTTLRYLHTSNKDLLKIISPLDDLKLD